MVLLFHFDILCINRIAYEKCAVKMMLVSNYLSETFDTCLAPHYQVRDFLDIIEIYQDFH